MNIVNGWNAWTAYDIPGAKLPAIRVAGIGCICTITLGGGVTSSQVYCIITCTI